MRNRYRRIIANYFSFTKNEQFVTLFIIITIMSFTGIYYTFLYYSSKETYSISSNTRLADSLNLLISNQREKNDFYKKEFFKFNPNQADIETLVELGFYESVAKRIVKYREKAPFKRASELKKIYGINEDFIDELEPYMIFDKNDFRSSQRSQDFNSSKDFSSYQKEELEYIVELNTAEAYELMLLKGIGKALSGNIVKYRDNLGGFISENQLLEVWGIDSNILIQNKGQYSLDKDAITKLEINSAEWKLLVRHPYIDGKSASLIVNYREQHGNYNSIDDLRKIKPFKEDFIQKILPYLSFE